MKITDMCTGCALCINICPQNAITMGKNNKGFIVPKVDNNLCSSCDKCKSICPQNGMPDVMSGESKISASWSKDDELRNRCTSGGVFYGLASKIICRNGVVYGAALNDKFDVEHIRVDSKEELYRLVGSKYVQSNMSNVFKDISEDLLKGKPVLFSGTPCQNAAIKKYIDNDIQENLYLIDIFCHGVPSPMFWRDYIDDKMDTIIDINEISFRDKTSGWTTYSMRIESKKGDVYLNDMYNDPFLIAFRNDYIDCETCYECKYASTKRQGDITLGDFWGYVSEKFSKRNTDKGISAVMINSEKGNEIYNEIKNEYMFVEKEIEEVKNGNPILIKPFKKNKRYDEFWNDYLEHGFEYVREKYLRPGKESKKSKISRMIDKYSFLMPFGTRKIYDKMKSKSKGNSK